LIKNSQPFGKKIQKTVGGIFFDSHCMCICVCMYVCMSVCACRSLVSASQDGKLIVWDGYTTNKVSINNLTRLLITYISEIRTKQVFYTLWLCCLV